MKLFYPTIYLSALMLCFSPMVASADETAMYVEESIFGGSVFVRLVGDKNKPAVVLVHGLGESASQHWNRTIKLLKSDYRVLALDLPGFGKSDKGNHLYSQANYARLIRRLSNKLLGKKFHLVGHSMGGAISVYYAARYPMDINTLTLIDVAGILHRAAYSKYLAVMGLDILLIDGIVDNKNDLLDWATEMVGNFEAHNPVDPAWILSTQFSREKILQGNPGAISGLAMISENFSLLAHRIRAPTLIIWGEQDKVAPLRTGYVLDAIIPVSTLHILPDVGHTPVREDPRAVHALLQAQLSQNIKSPIWKKVNPMQQGYKAYEQCKDSNHKRYTGHIGQLIIQDCRKVMIENAVIDELLIVNSDVEMLSSTIKGIKRSMKVTNSNVTITAASISGKTGIRVKNSRLDIAGSKFIVSRDAILADTESQVMLSLVYKQNETPPDSPLHGVYILQSGDSL